MPEEVGHPILCHAILLLKKFQLNASGPLYGQLIVGYRLAILFQNLFKHCLLFPDKQFGLLSKSSISAAVGSGQRSDTLDALQGLREKATVVKPGDLVG